MFKNGVRAILVIFASLLGFFGVAQNPLAPAGAFNIFTEGNLTMSGGDVEGALGAGGDFIVSGTSQYVQTNSSNTGSPWVSFSGINYAMVVAGKFVGTSGNFNVNGNLNNWIRFGNLNGATNGTSNGNQLKPTLNGVFILVNNTNQAFNQITGTIPVNFATAFTTLKSTSTALASCPNNVTPTFAQGSINPVITLASGRNVWNITGAQLNGWQSITFNNKPTANQPLVINVNAAGTLNLTMPNLAGIGPLDAPFVVFNFHNATTINYGGGATIIGSVLAPLADIVKTAPQNIDGQVIAKTFRQTAGEVHHAPFGAQVASCTAVCDPDNGAAPTFCAPAPICASGGANLFWSQTINSANGTPSTVRLVSGSTTTFTIPNASLPALLTSGQAVVVNITDVVSYDGYAGRSTVTQPNERWRITFRKGGTTVFSSNWTTDVPDLRNQGYWRGALNSATLPAGADEVRIEHWALSGDASNPNSVVPVSVCVQVTAACVETRIHNETFPNEFNTGFTRPINSTFTGSTGTWNANSTDVNSTIVLNNVRNTSSPNAIKIVNYITSNAAASTSRATSPVVNLSSQASAAGLDLAFRITSYTLDQANTCFNFHVDFSADNGTNWTTVYTRSAQELVNTLGSDTWSGDIRIPIASNFRTANFRYRVRGAQAANCGFNSYVYVDDMRIFSNTCAPNNLTLGNLVWADFNDNGVRDAGEPGYEGATVRLYLDNNNDGIADAGWTALSTTTNINGNYQFTNLPAGRYFVQLENVPSWLFRSTVYGGQPDNNIDNDNNGQTQSGTVIKGEGIQLTNGAEPSDNGSSNFTYDFGVFKGNGLGDFVWLDENANGIQDSGEPGIANVTVRLRNVSTDAILATTTTGSDGFYYFYDPQQYGTNNYTIEFVTPSGLVATASNQGSDDSRDSDPVNGRIVNVNVPQGIWNHTFDAGFVRIGSIGDRVWNDANRDGIQNNNEVGVAGVTVSLFNAAGNLVATTVTDGMGNYRFSNLPVATAGTNYQVRFGLSPAYAYSPQAQGSSNTLDSDPNPTTGRTGNVTLTPANLNRTDVDAGLFYILPNRIGDFIWNDLDRDGIQDAGEPGIAGVTITLYNSTGVAIRTTVTDNNGFYQFTDLTPGTNFTLGLTPPVGYILSTRDQGTDDVDSDFDPITFRTSSFTVNTNTVNLTFDGGLQVTPVTRAAVGDRVWHDLNNDGLQTAGEPGVAGVTVELFNSSATLVATQITDAFGNYMFNNLMPGAYYIRFSNLPATFQFVTQNVGGNPNVSIDSDPNPNGITATFNLVADQTLVTIDAGIRSTATSSNSVLGDFVWYDINRDGLQDAGEAGVPGVTVQLYNATTGALVATRTTDGNGLYLFTGLATGSYVVAFTNIPSGYIFTRVDAGADGLDSDVNPATGRTGTYVISADGSSIRTVDAGIVSSPNVRDSKGTIGDFVWNDINNNGLQDAGEPGVPGVTVNLFDGASNTIIATTTTDGLGGYLFTNLSAGQYSVGFVLPSGYVFTSANTGTNDAIDSDANATTGRTDVITLAAGEVNTTLDGGIRLSAPRSSLGDKVWVDTNGNGIQDAGEPGVAGVTVTLFSTSNAVLAVTASDVNGNYMFTGLDAGSYIIGFSNLPGGYSMTTRNASGSTAANNSDAFATTGLTSTITLAANTSDMTWDAGIVSTTRAAVGDYVWADANQNGIQDAGELPVAGITVTLFNSSNVAVSTAITDGNGFYFFNNLMPGTYTIGFSNLPMNTGFTARNAAGSTAANNSDANPTGITDAFTLTAGQVRTDIDAGLIALFAAVGDYVWFDRDANGRQDASELPVPGVTVTLFDANGNRVASAVTNGNGRYFINNIPVAAGGSSFTIGFSDLPINTQAYTIKNSPIANANNNSDANPASGRTDAFTLNPGQIRLDIDAGIITDGGGPLPVTLGQLRGAYQNGVSNLTWNTESEYNFSHFEVEFSTDGARFAKIGDVAGAGNSSVRRSYALTHRQPVTGVNYYRLKMVDIDGRYAYSNVVVLNVTVKGFQVTGAYPNPFIDRVNLSVVTDQATNLRVRILNAAGQTVYNAQAQAQRGTNVVPVNGLARLATGQYIIEVRTDNNEVFTQQLIK